MLFCLPIFLFGASQESRAGLRLLPLICSDMIKKLTSMSMSSSELTRRSTLNLTTSSCATTPDLRALASSFFRRFSSFWCCIGGVGVRERGKKR